MIVIHSDRMLYGCCHRLLLGIQHQSKPLGCPKLSTDVHYEAIVKHLDDSTQTPRSFVFQRFFCSPFPPGVVKAQLQAQLLHTKYHRCFPSVKFHRMVCPDPVPMPAGYVRSNVTGFLECVQCSEKAMTNR